MKNNTFLDFLSRQAHIREKQRVYYQKWVSDYLGWKKRHPEAPLKEFLHLLEKRFSPWQVDQAREAIALYTYFSNHKSSPGPTLPAPENRTPQDQTHINHVGSTRTTSPIPKPTTWQAAEIQAKELLYTQNKAHRTVLCYLGWIRRLSQWTEKQPPALKESDLKQFLSYLAVDQRVSVATQRQAFNALLFFYRYLLDTEIEDLSGTVSSRISRKLPVVLSRPEIDTILGRLPYPQKLMCRIIYGGGLRISECLSLRIKDLDMKAGVVTIRQGKGNKDRSTLLPTSLNGELETQIGSARLIFDRDREENQNGVPLPYALERKYPNAGKEWSWFWLFPSHRLSIDPAAGVIRRYHLYPTTLQTSFKDAVRKSGITKHATVHTLRNQNFLTIQTF